ncbi:MAG: multicopper oxidase domain-containing protein [Crocinitomicaceae bacterium]|nr:multicopper oxidase domain-containing protein [Crocinitomicaceae bacterium]
MRFIILVVLGFLVQDTIAATLDVRLVIQAGTINLSGATLDARTFSQNTTFQPNSDILIWTTNDDVNLRVVNLDSDPHGFEIDGYTTSFGTIAPGDSSEQNIVLSNAGVFRYFDNLNSPFNAYLGLSGVIHVKDASDTTPYFYWDIREYQELWNAQIIGGSNPALNSYDPEQFTINGNHYPNTVTDPLARVTGNVGNAFKVVVVNNGLSIHSLHFHGYHLSIEADSKYSYTLGRSKDTFPVHPEEHLVLSCTPDKEGEYPVHDHNLVAVTGGGEYSTGMLLTILIDP